MANPDLFILAQDDAWENRFQVTSLAASAVAAGKRVDLALFFAALDAWVGERWDDPEPARHVAADRLHALDMPPLSSMLAPGREAPEGGGEPALRLLACSASSRILGLANHDVQARVDAIAGWPTFHRLIHAAGQVVTL